ncbi:MAG: glutamate--cysteine ligase [Alcaligenaceae bacterium]|nr:glutamate--cysteine ligase [Alcaligenaceae bacterium]
MINSIERQAILRNNPQWLQGILRGVEKEGLRVDTQGRLARTPHPASLGAALTNPHITTDYSEALLELITGTCQDSHSLIDELLDTHSYVARHLDGELIWNQSMPAHLPPEAEIPVGWYGTSNTGMLKHVYRQGLARRYGKVMQCIAGVHYNFSLPEAIWEGLGTEGDTPMQRRNTGYMALIRNFVRHAWLLMYLFGASPAVSRSFLQNAGIRHQLERVEADTYIMPWATSLRMSDLGYKSPIQSELELCYNDLDTFMLRIYDAVTTPWPEYERLGTRVDGQWIQLNTSILQIENEYYSNIRPKQTTSRCERPTTALRDRGIQYVEVRCLDIDPEAPAGISVQTSRFMDAFLLFCAIEDSPLFPAPGFCQDSQDNFATVAREGRKPGLQLSQEGRPIALKDWGLAIVDRLMPYAQLLDDAAGGGNDYTDALNSQRTKLVDLSATPSARLITQLRDSGQSFHDWTLRQSSKHWETLRARTIPAQRLTTLDQAVGQSIQAQHDLEAGDHETFAEYVARFHAALGPHPGSGAARSHAMPATTHSQGAGT